MSWRVQCAANCGAQRWARLRKYFAALLHNLPARVCCGYARSPPLAIVGAATMDTHAAPARVCYPCTGRVLLLFSGLRILVVITDYTYCTVLHEISATTDLMQPYVKTSKHNNKN
ncbi:hypothetical protein JG688_00015714 [Phytophthora aleatoria]|uniref:Uncharacterized protein n=1 Tax=Phytophthora aleatoria TaxID=2496075 RepID=A0A8J5ISS7_9STRA|nr:hypothetical protein JG688_00015714 [Phytophthora aleatoria]